MTRKYQKIMRSTTAFLEMKESDILNLGNNRLPPNKLPKHIVPPYPQNNDYYSQGDSHHLYPHICDLNICDLKVTQDQVTIDEQITSLKFMSVKNFCLLSERNKEMEKVN